jgi:tRNA pseudouridine13 synthase
MTKIDCFQNEHWAYAYEKPNVKGIIRENASDFQVKEILSFKLDEAGEHVWIYLEKTHQNTAWVAKQLALHYEIPIAKVNWSGLKDRHAITSQWFSFPYPIKNELPPLPEIPDVKILLIQRHSKRIRLGTHEKNHFFIRCKNLEGSLESINDKLETIKKYGVPNYFGEQRFGHNLSNLHSASAWFLGQIRPRKDLRSMLLSAARSYLFNEHLHNRITQLSWRKIQDDEFCMFSTSNSWFRGNPIEKEDLQKRLDAGEIHTTGPLWGKGSISDSEIYLSEQYPITTRGLEENDLDYQRRSLILIAESIEWKLDLENKSLDLSFFLESGAFATSILREILSY